MGQVPKSVSFTNPEGKKNDQPGLSSQFVVRLKSEKAEIRYVGFTVIIEEELGSCTTTQTFEHAVVFDNIEDAVIAANGIRERSRDKKEAWVVEVWNLDALLRNLKRFQRTPKPIGYVKPSEIPEPKPVTILREAHDHFCQTRNKTFGSDLHKKVDWSSAEVYKLEAESSQQLIVPTVFGNDNQSGHEIYLLDGYVYDPMYRSEKVNAQAYLRMIEELNPGKTIIKKRVFVD